MNTTCFDAGDMADNAAKAFRENLQTHAEETAKLLEQRDELLAALVESRETLQRANDEYPSAIKDTIWHTDYETLFDFMDEAITRATQSTTKE